MQPTRAFRLLLYEFYFLSLFVPICLSFFTPMSCFIFKKFFFEDTCPFIGLLIPLFLDFWWYLLWVSKPEWAALFMLVGGVYIMYSQRFTSGATPANLLQSVWQPSCSLPHTCKQALVGLKTGTYHAATHSVRPGRRSTWFQLFWTGLPGFIYLIQDSSLVGHRPSRGGG